MQIQLAMLEAVNIPTLLIMKADKNRYEKRIKQGLPLLDRQDILLTLNKEEWRGNVFKIIQFLEKKRPHLAEDIERIKEFFKLLEG